MFINLLVLFLLGMVMQCLGRNNYEVRMESIIGLDGEEETLADYHGFKIVGRERALNGTNFYSIDFTDDLEISCKLFTFEFGAWVQSPYEIKRITPCSFFKNYFMMYTDIKNVDTNYPKTEAGYCPLRKGEYWIKNGIPNTDKWVAYLKRGLTKLRAEGYKNGKLIGGFEIVANVFDRTF